MANKECFLIQILECQNATWQGTILWTETGRKESFRSALELLQLIDSTQPSPPLNKTDGASA